MSAVGRGMRLARWSTHLAVVSVLGCAGVACDDPALAVPPLVSASARPPDEIDPNELLEGKVDAFGLKMPMRASVTKHTPDWVLLDLPYPLERVSSYLRVRLEAGSVDVGPSRTVFREATVKTGDPNHRFEVVVSRVGGASRVSMILRASAGQPMYRVLTKPPPDLGPKQVEGPPQSPSAESPSGEPSAPPPPEMR